LSLLQLARQQVWGGLLAAAAAAAAAAVGAAPPGLPIVSVDASASLPGTPGGPGVASVLGALWVCEFALDVYGRWFY
jgi:hypothetical protein